jgi:Xaa-Pro aminopeptidase
MSMMTRRDRVSRLLPEGVGGFLVTTLVNVRYLSGFTGSNGALLMYRDGQAVLATDGRYATQARQEAAGIDVVISRRPSADLVDHARRHDVRRLAFEPHRVTLKAYEAMSVAGGGDVDLVDGGEAVEQLRTVKDTTEIAYLAQACKITDDSFAAVLGHLRPGVTELDISWRLREEMHERGAEPSFDSIVAFGPNSARPHHQPTSRALEAGDFVKMDFGACVEGYHADMTRTVCCGPAAEWQRDLHGLVAAIQQEARSQVRPGAVPVDLDAWVRGRIEDAGYDVAHGLGHGVGLEIHESPFLVPDSPAARLVDRVAVTVEPGIYLPGRGGVRIEDTVVVGATGGESLTSSSRELIEI